MIRVRFAPSPSGYLHLGNVRTALFNYLFAKKENGKFILRIEDTDKERVKDEYKIACIRDLKWLGIFPDEGPEVGGNDGPYEQSKRIDIYKRYIKKLLDEGKAYYCYVTSEEIEQDKKTCGKANHFKNKGRDFTKKEIEIRKNKGIIPTVRFKIEKPKLTITDLIRGEVLFNLDDMVGDFVIQRSDGTPTFHLALCVDDALMGITHVIRGEDHLSNTPKHVLLFEALGFSPPKFGHLSLIHGEGGEALSKRLESVSVREFRKKGYIPEALANYIALLGWSAGDDKEIYSWDELQKEFCLGRVGRSSSNFDRQKLNWVNGEHIRDLTDSDFIDKALVYLKEQNKLIYNEETVKRILPVFKINIEKLEDLDNRLMILADALSYENINLISKPEAKEIFKNALELLPLLKEEDEALYQEFINELKPKVSSKGKELFQSLRLALTGREHGPELKKMFPLLGLDLIKKRFEQALSAQ